MRAAVPLSRMGAEPVVSARQEPIAMLERTTRKGRTEVTFVLPADTPPA